jgi:hypothetical protein
LRNIAAHAQSLAAKLKLAGPPERVQEMLRIHEVALLRARWCRPCRAFSRVTDSP